MRLSILIHCAIWYCSRCDICANVFPPEKTLRPSDWRWYWGTVCLELCVYVCVHVYGIFSLYQLSDMLWHSFVIQSHSDCCKWLLSVARWMLSMRYNTCEGEGYFRYMYTVAVAFCALESSVFLFVLDQQDCSIYLLSFQLQVTRWRAAASWEISC